MFRSLTAVRPLARAVAPMKQTRAFGSYTPPSVHVWDMNPEIMKPLTPEEANQADHNEFELAKYRALCGVSMVVGALIVRYWYHKEHDHFLHHRHQHEPYAFFLKHDNTAAGFWPGRKCQFLEFNCFSAVYDAADRMLAEKRAQKAEENQE